MDSIRVSLVGCGGVARKYRGSYRSLAGVSVQVTVDVDAAEAEAAKSETGAARASVNFADALADDVDAAGMLPTNPSCPGFSPSPRILEKSRRCIPC